MFRHLHIRTFDIAHVLFILPHGNYSTIEAYSRNSTTRQNGPDSLEAYRIKFLAPGIMKNLFAEMKNCRIEKKRI